MKRLLFFFAIIVFSNCSDSDEAKCLSYSYSTSVDFQVFNSKGEDLLNAKNVNHLDMTKIKIFYVVNGVVEEYYKPGSEVPKGFEIYNPEDGGAYRMRVFLNTIDKSKKTKTYIQWDEDDKDILDSEIEIGDCYTHVIKIWLNGEIFRDIGMYENFFYPTIIK